jgi:hypothetical protein
VGSTGNCGSCHRPVFLMPIFIGTSQLRVMGAPMLEVMNYSAHYYTRSKLLVVLHVSVIDTAAYAVSA